MKPFLTPRRLPTALTALLVIIAPGALTTAHAQAELAAKPVSSELRQRLRAAILELAAAPPNIVNVRPDLALPLAQVGDWDGALRLLRDDINAPRHRDALWQRRAYQLARAGKWREVPAAAAHITRVAVRADVLLFAARSAMDRGVVLETPLAGSAELKALMLQACALLARGGTRDQKIYSATLWARGGDYEAARRVFARELASARRWDAAQNAKYKRYAKFPGSGPFVHQTEQDVLRAQARAGFMRDALRDAGEPDDFLLGWLIAYARTREDREALDRIIETLPECRRITPRYELSMAASMRGDKEQGRAWYQQARALAAVAPMPAKVSPDARVMNFGQAQFAVLAARALHDAALEAEALQELRVAAAQVPTSPSSLKPNEIEVFATATELVVFRELGGATSGPAPPRLDEIATELMAAPPSKVQFRGLEMAASHYLHNRQTAKLLPVAQTMLRTAQQLAKEEAAKRAKQPSRFNPYWPTPPRVLTSIFWLQRAGDTGTEPFAREFARNAPPRERPYAAMTLLQLGFPTLADSICDPLREIPRMEAVRLRPSKSVIAEWGFFQSWNEFAAAEARYRAPDAPFRWYHKLPTPSSRAEVLRAWVAALYPQPRQTPPYVTVTPEGSESAS